MFVVGVTGGIGTGKSTVSKILNKMGLQVLDADQISHDVTGKNGVAVAEIILHFGEGILNEQGEIDRRLLGSIVFQDKNKLDLLSEIVHRQVIKTLQEEVAKLEKKKVKALVLDVPIPVKEGFLDLSDHVLVVWAKPELRISRLAKRGMGREEALRRMAMQMTEEEYSRLGHEVIRNDGSLKELIDMVEAFAKRELRSRGIPLKQLSLEDLECLGLAREKDYLDVEAE